MFILPIVAARYKNIYIRRVILRTVTVEEFLEGDELGTHLGFCFQPRGLPGRIFQKLSWNEALRRSGAHRNPWVLLLLRGGSRF